MSAVRQARQTELAEVSRVLALAFQDDPFWRWLIREGEGYQQRLERGFMAQLQHMALPRGLIHTAEGIPGAAVWSPPGTWETNLFRHLRFLPQLAALLGPARMPSRMLGIHRVQRLHPDYPHWYLQILGVDPGRQGKGWARTLLSPVLERCDRDQLPAYLETCNPDNIPLYRGFGFALVNEVTLGRDAPTAWCMERPPQS